MSIFTNVDYLILGLGRVSINVKIHYDMSNPGPFIGLQQGIEKNT